MQHFSSSPFISVYKINLILDTPGLNKKTELTLMTDVSPIRLLKDFG